MTNCSHICKDNNDKARPNCAVVGVYNNPEASIMAYYALHALQHRGQEASGITTIYYDEAKQKKKYAYIKGEGLVLDVFSEDGALTEVLKGDIAVGHNRYSTTGASKIANIQPFNMIYKDGILSLAHNGNLTNTKTIKKMLQDEGAIFQTTTDSEVFLHLIARSKKETKVEQIREALQTAQGAYSVCVITDEGLVAARDPHGGRPLSIGRKMMESGKYSYMVASESAAFDIVNYEYVRSLKHNEMIVINEKTVETGEIESYNIIAETPIAKHCIFEYVYFSRPDSKIFGHNVDKVRRKLGKNLSEESPVYPVADEKINVISVPDSSNTAALGYARINDKNVTPTVFEIGLIRSHYVGRTFISPGQNNREFKVKTKFNTVKGVIENRNIVVIDDSIVRGTTSKALMKLIKDSNPLKIHMRVSSPPVKFPCFYGMDFPSREELIANQFETEEDLATYIGVDTLKYLSLEKMIESMPQDEGVSYCDACFTGNYPIPIENFKEKLNEE